MAGFAMRSRFAGLPSRSTKTRHAPRLKPDHPIGAVHDPDRCFDLVGDRFESSAEDVETPYHDATFLFGVKVGRNPS